MDPKLGYLRVATAVPPVQPGAVRTNLDAILKLARSAERQHCDLTVFPELCLTGYTCADLFQQETLLAAAEGALAAFLKATATARGVFLLGLPVRTGNRLFNVAAVCCRGRLLGLVPKRYLPNYREFYEQRWFTSGSGLDEMITLAGQEVPLAAHMVFRADSWPLFTFGVEICEDLWAPVPPSSELALTGATLFCNLSASNELVGKAAYRRQLVLQQSARCLAGYVYCSAGPGESTTDTVYGGHCLIAENGMLLAESRRFERGAQLTVADLDLGFLDHDRRQNMTFSQAVKERQAAPKPVLMPEFPTRNDSHPAPLLRPLNPQPFVPANTAERNERCEEIFAIQSTGLATRLQHSRTDRVVIGLSGGLDSTLALLVTVEAFTRLGLPRANIHALTMPGFGTSTRTLRNVKALCRQLGVALATVDIKAACRQHLADLGHDGSTGDVVYENTQARERTQILMDKANMLKALVVGTGDLSELALGWCTYNGDHISMYGVNAGVPKTLVQYLVLWVAEHRAEAAAKATLRDILATPISPELLPLDAAGEISQKTECVIGPYELHDFFLFELVRRGSPPAKIRRLAEQAFAGRYPPAEICRWFTLFITRFFSQQFKRSCLPDGPKVGTLSLSPRGDWRMPSDASPEPWLI